MKSLRYFVPQLGSLATYPSPPLAIDLSHSVQAVEFRFFPNREREIFAAARSRSSSKDYNSIRDRQNSGKLERSYAKIFIGSRLFLTAMAIHLSLRVAPLDLQQGGNSRIPYVHVPAARMSILVYIATAINTFLFLLTKHPLFLRSFGTGTEMGAFSTLFTLVTGGFRGRPMWGTFWVWDARLTSVLISFLIYMGALRFQKLPIEPAPISIRAGPIDIPIIKSSVNWWNTSHQPGSISRYGTSIHVPMPIPILSNFANSPFSTRILFVLETRLLIPSFLESPLTEEIEAQEGIPKPSSLAESEHCPTSLIGFLSVHHGVVGIKVGLRRAGQPVSLHTAQRLAICIHPCNLPKRGSHAIIERLPNRHTQVPASFSGSCLLFKADLVEWKFHSNPFNGSPKETGANGISIKGAMTTEHANKANSENRLLSQVTEREILAAELSSHSRCQLRDRTTMRRDTDRLPSHT
ncbi:hypothetical protein L1987_89813 [Smallanthus sonchifolius]|nr:hypothetical protein L1987_89813 [Smallanthus sonchifolius]